MQIVLAFHLCPHLLFHVAQATASQAVRHTAEIKQIYYTTWQLRHKRRKNVILLTFRPDAIVMDHSLRVGLVKAGPEKYQNKGPFAAPSIGDSTKKLRRSLSKEMVLLNIKNADIILRSWLFYSKWECGAYCFCCKLFGLGNYRALFVAKTSITFWSLFGLELA